MTKENIPEYSVTELSTALKSTIEDKFGYVRIKGELSGINNHSSGHIYLTLKDENAVINGIIWRSSVAKKKFVQKKVWRLYVQERLAQDTIQGDTLEDLIIR